MIGPGGSAGAFRRSAWEQVGGLDETIGTYYEDFDLIVRLLGAGWRTVLAMDAVAVHIGSATYGHRSTSARHKGAYGRAYLLRRYGVLRTRAALRALATEGILVVADLAVSRDLVALRGRLAGWRAAGGLPSRPLPAAALEGRDLVRRQPAHAP